MSSVQKKSELSTGLHKVCCFIISPTVNLASEVVTSLLRTRLTSSDLLCNKTFKVNTKSLLGFLFKEKPFRCNLGALCVTFATSMEPNEIKRCSRDVTMVSKRQ